MFYTKAQQSKVKELLEKSYKTAYFEFFTDRFCTTLTATAETLWCEAWTFKTTFRTVLYYKTDEATFLAMAAFVRFA